MTLRYPRFPRHATWLVVVAAMLCLGALRGPSAWALARTNTETEALPPQAEATGWWQGFEDPALDALMRAGLGNAAADPTQRAVTEARIANAYVTARWMAAKLTLTHDLHQLLEQRRRWATAEGPTAHAARSLAAIEQAAASLDDKAAQAARLLTGALAGLQALSPLPAPEREAVIRSISASASVPLYAPPVRLARLGFRPDAAGPRAELARRAADVQAQAQGSREQWDAFAAVRKQLETGTASEAQALVLYEQLLFSADRLMRAQAELALGWVQVLAAGR